MSAGCAVNRTPPDSLSLFKRSAVPSTSLTDRSTKSNVASHATTQTQTCDDATSDLERRLREALRERDEQWRKHEKAQIQFLQQESAAMLKGLHSEIERLSHHLRDAKRQLFVSGPDEVVCDHSIMDKKVMHQEDRIRHLEQEIHKKELQAKTIEGKVTMTIEKLQEQINLQADRIRQLADELNDRNQTVAHLSSQLRSFRLRDAMATAQQRRRASKGEMSPPLVSPSSPHRIFPPRGVLSASVTVTYPGSRSNVVSSSADEGMPRAMSHAASLAASRRKSASSVGLEKNN